MTAAMEGPRPLRRRVLTWLVVDGRTTSPGEIVLWWYPERPLEVPIELGRSRGWLLSRDLLLDGSAEGASSVGAGDVVVGPGEEWGMTGRVLLTLRSPDGHAVVAVARWGLRQLLEESLAVSPRGGEVVDIDGCVAGLLAES